MFRIKAKFAISLQALFERYYLQPIDGLDKKSLQDGYLERQTHGAMHASRATLWALFAHRLLIQLTPHYVETALQKIAEYLASDTESVLFLICLTTACHDAGRKGEGMDEWESESGKIAASVLQAMGLLEQHVALFEKAIANKDERACYFYTLQEQGIPEADYHYFDYIRILINLGDNFDLVRCASPFKIQYLFKTLTVVQGFDVTKHRAQVVDLLNAIHQFVYDQYDMQFDCSVHDVDQRVLWALERRYSYKVKIQYEHAENIWAVMVHEAAEYSAFQAYLASEDFTFLPPPKKYRGDLKFNPLIHGTNAAVFAILLKTDFHLLPIMEMLGTYYAAPVTGELVNGGYDTINSTGNICFARMIAPWKGAYDLERVLSRYAFHQNESPDMQKFMFRYVVGRGFRQMFLNINLILIYFARSRQLVSELETLISGEDLRLLQNRLDATVQFYYLLQLLGTYIHPDFAAFERLQAGERQMVLDGLYTFCSFEQIIENIIAHKVDIKAILQQPTPENLARALMVLEFPKTGILQTGFLHSEKMEVVFSRTQYFCLYPSPVEMGEALFYGSDAAFVFQHLSKNDWEIYMIASLLSSWLKREIYPEFFDKFNSKVKQHATAFEERVQLFHALARIPQSQFTLTEQQKIFLTHSFPLVFVTDNEEKVVLFHYPTQEYRSASRLKLGVDIKMIATDTSEHRLMVMKWLAAFRIHGIQVILLCDLQESKISKLHPKEPYHHAGGVPTLKWIAAKKAALVQHGIFKSSPFPAACADKAMQLMKDANVYHTL